MLPATVQSCKTVQKKEINSHSPPEKGSTHWQNRAQIKELHIHFLRSHLQKKPQSICVSWGLHNISGYERIGAKRDMIRCTIQFGPLHNSTKVCVYTERIDNFVRAPCLRKMTVFPSFRNLPTLFLTIFFVQWECSPIQTFFFFDMFECSFTLKNVFNSSVPWSIAAKQRGKRCGKAS